MEKKAISTYQDFWPFYLKLHSKRGTKLLHAIGLVGGIILFGTAILKQSGLFLALAPVSGYGFAWISHFTIEKNRPATWEYPLWSFISDFRMTALFLSGKL